MKNVDFLSDIYEEIERLARQAKDSKSRAFKERMYIQIFNALLDVTKSSKKKPTHGQLDEALDTLDYEQIYVLEVINDSFRETLIEFNKHEDTNASFLKLYFKIYQIKAKRYIQAFYGEENDYRKAAVRDLLKTLSQNFKVSILVENKKLLNEAFVRATIIAAGVPVEEFDFYLKEIFENKHIVFASDRDKSIGDTDEETGSDGDSDQSGKSDLNDTGDDDSSSDDGRIALSDLRDDPAYQKMIAVFEFVGEMVESSSYSDAQKQNIRCYMTWKIYEHYEKVYLDTQYEFMDEDLWAFIEAKKKEDEGMKIADILAGYLSIQPDTARKCLKKAEKDIQLFVASKMRVN